MRKALSFLALVTLLAACATTEELPLEVRRRTYDAEKDSVISAIATTLTEEGYQIDQIDREAGLVITDTRKTFGMLSGLDRSSVTAQVQGQGDQTQVTLTISTEQEGGLLPGSRMTRDEAQEAYDQLFRAIRSNLQE